MSSSAERLEGMELDGGWKVKRRIERKASSTGGHFSQSYLVEKADGQRGFLKALDYSWALQQRDPAVALEALTHAFNFERKLLFTVRDRRCDRVVMPLDHGMATVSGAISPDPGIVQYLIFEMADGDLRSQAEQASGMDLAWNLRALHHIATGLTQLHSADIAHQDLKPSNVVVFKRNSSKVADLGRACQRGADSPHEHFHIAGDKGYAPPELLYSAPPPDWNVRRLGCDMYLLGSMVFFFFAGAGLTPLVQARLAPDFRWQAWKGNYGDVLPHIRDAQDELIYEVASKVPLPLRPEIVAAMRELCDPDPALRGHPHERGSSITQHSLRRYLTKFDLWAQRVESGMFGRRR